MMTNASATTSRPPAVRVGAAIALAAAASVGHCGGFDGADHMVFNGGAADRVPARVRDGVERAVRIATLAFWKAYLEDDADARRFLQGSGMRDTLGAAGSWDAK